MSYLCVVKPVTRYFITSEGRFVLNTVGLHMVRSYALQSMGILKDVCNWEQVPVVQEPIEVQEQKCRAWMLAKEKRNFVLNVSEEEDTDVEDEKSPPMRWVRDPEDENWVPESQLGAVPARQVDSDEETLVPETQDETVSSTHDSLTGAVYNERGVRVHRFDQNVEWSETDDM